MGKNGFWIFELAIANLVDFDIYLSKLIKNCSFYDF